MARDPDPVLAAEHTPEAIAARIRDAASGNHLGDFVLGAVDGTVTTFAIVAAAAGAGLSGGVAIVLGLANIVADGFSMASSNYLKARSDHQLLNRFRAMEEMHIERIPEGEIEEIRQIYSSKGFEGPMLDDVVRVITRDRRRWVDTMLSEEWGLHLYPVVPWRAAASTFVAFLVAGMVPLLPLFFLDAQPAFVASSLATAVAFFSIGLLRGVVTRESRWKCAAETLLIGGAAASLAYVVGSLFRGFT